MLKFLSIKNLAVIEQVKVDLYPGLNVLTGETGAGKSIIVDALGLLLGGRVSSDLIRTGERVAIIEGLFDLAGRQKDGVQEILTSAGISSEQDEEVLIRREVQLGDSGAGRSRFFVNDHNVTAMTLRKLQPLLVVIHGQGDQQSLFHTRAHLDRLDTYADSTDLRREIASVFSRWRQLRGSLDELRRNVQERERTSDLLRYQIMEIERVAPRVDEDDELAAERVLLINVERALELGTGAYAQLYESDESILGQIALVRRQLQELMRLDTRVASAHEGVEAAELALIEVAQSLRNYGADLNFSSSRLMEIENRLLDLEKLKRRYGRDLRGVDTIKQELRLQLSELDNAGEQECALEEELERVEREYLLIAQALTEKRRAAAPKLEEQMVEQLQQVAMEQARFIVSIETAPLQSEGRRVEPTSSPLHDKDEDTNVSRQPALFSPTGADRVEFFLSANPGEDPRPLARIASGGELSRLMLTLRTVCREKASRDFSSSLTLVFDEIDAGIGGQVAERVGRRMKSLGERQQVLCVTHQSQIARFADAQYRVGKHVANGRTLTVVEQLSSEERISELARMIGGSETIETARETARWMLTSEEAIDGDARQEKPKTEMKGSRRR